MSYQIHDAIRSQVIPYVSQAVTVCFVGIDASNIGFCFGLPGQGYKRVWHLKARNLLVMESGLGLLSRGDRVFVYESNPVLPLTSQSA